MTLTSSIPGQSTQAKLLDTLTRHFTALDSIPLTDLCLFAQPDPRSPFTLTDRFPCSQP
jgi:hypothetical protein